MDESLPESPGPQFTLRDMLVAIAVVALLLGVTLPAIRAAREGARLAQCQNNLQMKVLALHNYHDTYKAFPLAYTPDENMQPRSSWRIAIAPFVESNAVYDAYQMHEPWNSPTNIQLGPQFNHCYRCPNEDMLGLDTCYVAVTGNNTPWPAPQVSHFKDFTRDLSSTIMISEMNDSGIHWMEPRDLSFDQMEFKIYAPTRLRSSTGRGSHQALSSAHPGGANVVFANGAVDFLSAQTSSQALREMFLIGEEPADDE